MACLHDWVINEYSDYSVHAACIKCLEKIDLDLRGHVIPGIADALGIKEEGRTVTLSSGIRIPIRAASPLLYQRVIANLQKQIPEPPIPKVRLETFEHPEGEWQENPNDPDYLDAVSTRQQAIGDKSLDALILMSLDVVLPADDFWIEKLRYLGVEVGESTIDRTLAYVRYILITTPDDMRTLTQATMRTVTVTEEAVEESTKST